MEATLHSAVTVESREERMRNTFPTYKRKVSSFRDVVMLNMTRLSVEV